MLLYAFLYCMDGEEFPYRLVFFGRLVFGSFGCRLGRGIHNIGGIGLELLVALVAGLAEFLLAGLFSLAYGAHNDAVLGGAVKVLAVGKEVVFLAGGNPINIYVGGVVLLLELFLADGIEVDTEYGSDGKAYDSYDGTYGLGFLVEILVGKDDDDNGDEGETGYDDAKIVLKPELGLVGFGSGVDVVGLLPEERSCYAGCCIEHQGYDHAGHLAHEGELVVDETDAQYFKNECYYPECDSTYAQALCVAFYLNLTRSGLAFALGFNDFLFCHNN